MTTRFTVIGIGVDHLKRTLDFYRDGRFGERADKQSKSRPTSIRAVTALHAGPTPNLFANHMTFGTSIGIMVGAFIALLLVVGWLMDSTKKAPPQKRDAGVDAAGASPPDASSPKGTGADEQSKNTTTAVAAWWWLNHNRESDDKRSGEDKSP
jgi:hypothetical protein